MSLLEILNKTEEEAQIKCDEIVSHTRKLEKYRLACKKIQGLTSNEKHREAFASYEEAFRFIISGKSGYLEQNKGYLKYLREYNQQALKTCTEMAAETGKSPEEIYADISKDALKRIDTMAIENVKMADKLQVELVEEAKRWGLTEEEIMPYVEKNDSSAVLCLSIDKVLKKNGLTIDNIVEDWEVE